MQYALYYLIIVLFEHFVIDKLTVRLVGRGGRVGKSAGLSIQRYWVRNPPTSFRILDKFVYPRLPSASAVYCIHSWLSLITVACAL